MQESIWPKLDVKRSTDKKDTEMITDSSMGMFNRTILMRRIGSSRMDLVVMIYKHIKNIGITIKLTTLVHKYILVSQERAMDLQPFA